MQSWGWVNNICISHLFPSDFKGWFEQGIPNLLIPQTPNMIMNTTDSHILMYKYHIYTVEHVICKRFTFYLADTDFLSTLSVLLGYCQKMAMAVKYYFISFL